jgi:ABC-type multidrug transport system permease subunit
MLRAILLSAQNDVRLLVKDPVVLLMLLLAPVVIITVAGYSLGAIYGGATHPVVVPLVDHDGGEVASHVIAALRDEPAVRLETMGDVEEARRLVGRTDGPALAIEIPSGTSAALLEGRSPRLVLYVDPAKRIEANALEVRLAELCRRATEGAHAKAQQRLDEAEDALRREVARLTQTLEDERQRVRSELDGARAAAAEALRSQLDAAIADVGRRIETRVRAREERAWRDLAAQVSSRRALLDELRRRLHDLQVAEAAFGDWLARVRQLAGSHAADIPPPPAFPVLPSEGDLATLGQPIPAPSLDRERVASLVPSLPSITIPGIELSLPAIDLDRLAGVRFDRLPGVLGLAEESASPGAELTVNAFDQYVPGFGITFLMIGMMLGIALTLVDERDWGTLPRLQASGVPLASLLLGKVLTRFAVGILQMGVLFTIGRVLFGISLGRVPAALLLPTAGISLAAAALGLIMPTLARSHDAVMPLGTMVSMAMSAIGGCWWPLDFEPPWMHAIARALPTTWAMEAYHDLMIRRAEWHQVVWPTTMTFGLGILYLALGIAGNVRRSAR